MDSYKKLFHPKWILGCIALPQLIFTWFILHVFYLISPELEKECLLLWKIFGYSFLFLLSGWILFYSFIWYKKIIVPVISLFIMIISYVSFSYFLVLHFTELLPWSIPTWMTNIEQIILYYFTCIAPGLFISILMIVLYFTPENKNIKSWLNFLFSISIPLIWYLFYTVILPLHKFPEKELQQHSIAVLFIITTIIFFFFLIRALITLIRKKQSALKKLDLIWKFLFGLVFPIAGLYFNHNLPEIPAYYGEGVFGNFNHLIYYIIAGINGILLMIPQINNKIFQTIKYCTKLITLPFTLYFLIVFIPFLPFSIIAIIFYGLGVLMLTPLILSIIHINSILEDYKTIKDYLSKKLLISISVFCIMIIPFSVIINYQIERKTIHSVLDYIYYPDYEKDRSINISEKKISRILKTIGKHNRRNFRSTPILGNLYKWIVLDNMTLSYEKINFITQVFFNKPIPPIKRRNMFVSPPDNCSYNIKVETKYNKNENFYRSWVHFYINNSTDREQEFRNSIKLKEGTFIGDYYLKIGKDNVPGQLVNKKAAVWIYKQIVRRRKDPGLVLYTKKDNITLRVFPVPAKGKRVSGIEFIHPEPVTIIIGNQYVRLGKEHFIKNSIMSLSKHVIYLSKNDKKKLNQIKRKPYYHFILDYSRSSTNQITDYKKQINEIINKRLIPDANYKISFANYEVNTINSRELDDKEWKNVKFQGGFYLERALKILLYDESKNSSDQFPVFIVLSPDINKAIYNNSLSYFQYFYPESDFFYTYKKGNIFSYKWNSSNLKYKKVISSFNWNTVLVWSNINNPELYIKASSASIIVRKDIKSHFLKGNQNELKYKSALELFGLWQYNILHPKKSDRNYNNLKLTGLSSRVLSPAMSFIVLENDAQRRRLNKAVKTIEKGKKGLDYDNMTEPEMLILVFLLILFLIVSLLKWKYQIKVKIN